MARLARLVVPGLPHQITQRGNRRQRTFFSDEDYAAYVELMAAWCGEHGVEIWAYCLMPNHVHLIGVPRSEDGLRRAIGEAHRRYMRRINFREKRRGYLWQGRFASFVIDEPYLLAAARYVELNPVRANLAGDAADWRWSSARPHLWGRDDRLVKVAPMLAMDNDWRALLGSAFLDRAPFWTGRLSGQGDGRRGVARLAQPWPQRSPAGRHKVCRTLGETRRSRPKPTKTRAKAESTQTATLSIVSPEFPLFW